ncbi:hypothetical protein [Parasynechococcus marenigrum]|nr:hypothetical protein [Parasynechococcus marenigrum]
MELQLEQPLTSVLSVKVASDVEPRLDHHCARLQPSGTLPRAALVRALLRKGLAELDELEASDER